MAFSDENFCGVHELWNLNITWWTSHPRFTPCFEWTALTYVPATFLWLAVLFSTPWTLHSRRLTLPTPLTWLGMCKTLLAALLSACYAWAAGSAALLAWSGSPTPQMTGGLVPPAKIVADAINCASCALVVLVQLLNRRAGRTSSGTLWTYWLLASVAYFPRYYRFVVENAVAVGALMVASSLQDYVIVAITYPLTVASLALNCFAERGGRTPAKAAAERTTGGKSPAMHASPLSVLLFGWVTPLVVSGFRRCLDLFDLYDPPPQLASADCRSRWVVHWEREISNAGYNPLSGEYDRKKPPSIWRSLFRVYWRPALLSILAASVRSFIRMCPPLIINLVTVYMDDVDQPRWKGKLYAVAMFGSSIISSLCYRHGDFVAVNMGLKIKGVLMSSIYAKALRLSASSRSRYTVGELTNMVSVDADKILRLCQTLSHAITCPLMIGLTTYILWQYLNWSCLVGLAVILLTTPISGLLAYKNKQLQVQQMRFKDKRLKKLNESICSMKILKLFAWEPAFMANIEQLRHNEVRLLHIYAYVTAAMGFLWTCLPFFVGLASFAAFVLSSEENVLTPTVAFVSLALINQMRFSLVILPDFISNAIQASVSIRRIRDFLLCEEADDNVVGENTEGGDAITLRGVTAVWSEKPEQRVLNNIDFHAPRGKIVALVGAVGSGKSSLLSAILSELNIRSGRIDVSGTVAYVPQQAWIQNKSIRDNITFLNPFDRDKYEKILGACCLHDDIKIFTAGDKTEIGEKGINVSGGQRQRISLARAAYQDQDIYLLDDPLSAVDAHVGKLIFKRLIGVRGLLRHKTRILVTNDMSLLPEVDHVFVLKNGYIVQHGSYETLSADKGLLAELVGLYRQQNQTGNKLKSCVVETGDFETSLQRTSSRGSDSIGSQSLAGSVMGLHESTLDTFNAAEKETIQEGAIKIQIYVNYLRFVGGFLASTTLLFYICYRVVDLVNGIWLARWSEDIDDSTKNKYHRLGTYAGIGVGQGLCQFLGIATLTKATLAASTKLHRLMLRSVMRAPLSFFDVTPVGRLLNRFGKDLDQLDVYLPFMANFALEMLLQIVGMIVLISLSIPIYAIIGCAALTMFVLLRQVFVRTLRQLKRMEAVMRSPVNNHLSETLSGLTNIRSCCAEDRFYKQNCEKIDRAQNCSFHVYICNYWLSIRLEFLCNLMIFIMLLMVVSSRDTIDAGTAGLLLSYSLSAAVAFNYFVFFSTEVETTIVAAERMDEYIQVESEASWTSTQTLAAGWPTRGTVEFQRFSARYRPHLDLVLRNVNFVVKPQQKVGIVGRTGAGKSSLILALFRAIEASEGVILIDDVDISTLGLHELRSRLTIIPQEPVLFDAPLRYNLDPTAKQGDNELWAALELAHLKRFFSDREGLDTQITENGGNLSAGQRQLICLARAVLRKTRILVLDEATASVDCDTDALIQKTIRQVFYDSTIITVAHRLNTIIDSDLIVVMAAGEVQETGHPRTLLQNPNSLFAALALEAGLTDLVETTKR